MSVGCGAGLAKCEINACLPPRKPLVPFNYVEHFYESLLARPDPLLLNIDGKAGTGKSRLIMLLSATLTRIAREAGVRTPILCAALTGVAAFNVMGRTLHSLFRLPLKLTGEHVSPRTDTLKAIQEVFHDIRYLIINEKSMVGLDMLLWIEQRCREIFPRSRDRYFGGLNVLLVGDFFQLPPVRQKPLFSDLATPKPRDLHAKAFYTALTGLSSLIL